MIRQRAFWVAGWIACFILAAVALVSRATAASPSPGELVKADLIAEPAAIKPGEPFWVALRLRIKDGWHVYWRNPGDSGEAPSITWHLPQGFVAGPIVWPTPHRIPIAHLVNFGYDRETLLLTQLTPPADLSAATPTTIKADAAWLVCEKECIPGEASIGVDLPVVARGAPLAPSPETKSAFASARALLPHASPWPARMDVGPEWLVLTVDAKGLEQDRVTSAYFFPNSETLVQHAAPQELRVGTYGLTLRIKRSALSTASPADAGGVLAIEELLGATKARQSFALANVAVGTAAPSHPATSVMLVLQAAALALLGGIILNLMPCVFPVLSIKVLGLIEQAGQSKESVRCHGLAYTAGVLVAFAALGGVLLSLRAAGDAVGWGFQLQSPPTVALLAYVLFAMGLNLSGVFQLGASAQGIGQHLTRHAGLAGTFFTGVLAAIVASPCTAPFMATAVGFALTQPAAVALAVFLALGFGLALPFLILTLAPQLISRLPRPGAWMETLKQLLAFPVYATVVWLMWILSQQIGQVALFGATIGLVLIALAAWSFNVWQMARVPWGRRIALAAMVVSIMTVTIAAAWLEPDRVARRGDAEIASDSGIEPFTQLRLDELRAAGRPVFVNMTATWCITCLVNETAALATDAVKSAFAVKDIAYLKGDWTNRNPEITRVLERHGRSGVPLYLLYPANGEPIVLPQILTPATVLGEIDRIGAGPKRKASLANTSKE